MILDQQHFVSLEKKIEENKIEIILSDIFDTLICRKVHPEFVKKLVSTQLAEWLTLEPERLYQERAELEITLYAEAEAEVGEKEFKYATFVNRYYDRLSRKFPEQLFANKKQFIDYYQALEMSAEKRVQYLDHAVVNFLRQQKQQGRKIILLSDFYMSEAMLRELLVHHQIEDLAETLIVSSDRNATKRSGKLYQLLINQQIIKQPQHCLMIGDNSHSDYFMAKQYHLLSHLLERSKQQQFYQKQMKQAKSRSAFFEEIKQLGTKRPPFADVNFSLLSFIKKLFRAAMTDKVENLYFLSREGELLKRMFDCYQQFLFGKSLKPIKTHYLLASRRSSASIGLRALEEENFEMLFRQYARISIADFVKSYGFCYERVEVICQSLGIKVDKTEDDLKNSESFRQLINCPEFVTLYDTHRKQQYANFIQYLKTMNYDPQQKQFALVDVGWKGTIQDNLANGLPEDSILKGYYIGLVAPGAMTARNQKQGLLFDYRHQDFSYWVYQENRSLFEVLLTAGHGSPEQYQLTEEGQIRVKLTENKDEKILYTEKVQPIQDFLEKNFSELLEIIACYQINEEKLYDCFVAKHEKMVFNPSQEELNWFINCYHIENFGVFCKSEFSCKQIKFSPVKSLKNFLQFMKGPKQYVLGAFWPTLRFKVEGLSLLQWMYRRYLARRAA